MSQQTFQLHRVKGRIRSCILSFLRAHEGQTFHMRDLDAYVMERAEVAPGSAGRVFRDLRKKGQCDVELVNRSASLYRVEAVA